MLVEDNEDDYILTREAFRLNGLEDVITWVRNGQEAIDYLIDGGDVVNLILLDLNMPRMDGREFLNKRSENDNMRKIPVIVLTTSGDPYDVDLTYMSCGSSFVRKPIDLKEFVEIIGHLNSFWFNVASLPSRGTK